MSGETTVVLDAEPAQAGGTPAPSDPSNARRPRRGERTTGTVARVATAIGAVLVLFVVFEFFVTDIAAIRSQRTLQRRFAEQLVTQTGFDGDGIALPGTPVALLTIPRIHLEEIVVEGTTPQLLKEGPGHFRNTPLPGQAGNSVIVGRRTTYGSPFGSLGSLEVGDQIQVTTAQGTFTYVVGVTGTVTGGQTDVLASTTDNRLTLVTSNPPYLASGRVGVVASLQGSALAAPVLVHPTSLAADETGLAGDTGGMPGVIVAAEVLASVGAVLWIYRRRWNRRVVYLLATPIVVMVLFILFENLDRLLPGSL